MTIKKCFKWAYLMKQIAYGEKKIKTFSYNFLFSDFWARKTKTTISFLYTRIISITRWTGFIQWLSISVDSSFHFSFVLCNEGTAHRQWQWSNIGLSGYVVWSSFRGFSFIQGDFAASSDSLSFLVQPSIQLKEKDAQLMSC